MARSVKRSRGGSKGADPERAPDTSVQRLEAELRVTKEQLQTTIEELMTSKEELQTVNGELAHRVGDLARANSDLKNLLESTRIATVFLDNELRLRSFTPAASDVFHLVEADVGRPIAHLTGRVAYPELQDDAHRVLKTLGQVEREVVGSEEDRRFLVRVLPYRSVDDFIAGVVVTFLEVTGTAQAEAALRASERRFGEAQQLSGIGVWDWNLEADTQWWSPVVYQLWGLPPRETPPSVSERRVHPDDRETYETALAEARTSGRLDVEWRVLLPDDSIRWLAETGRMDRPEGGRRMLGVIQDVTDRKATETRLTTLFSELQHRVRNILGVVRSVVSRTIRSSTSLEELAASLDGRLDSLARTQGVFTRSDVSAVDLEELIREEFISVAAREEHLNIEGPLIQLKRDAAETLALALHELTTNAVKYGALAEPAGRVSVTWGVVNTAQGPRLSLEWRESGVRALNVRPSRAGFGRELIEHGLPYELGARTALEFAQGGVKALIELPLTEKIAELDPLAEGRQA